MTVLCMLQCTIYIQAAIFMRAKYLPGLNEHLLSRSYTTDWWCYLFLVKIPQSQLHWCTWRARGVNTAVRITHSPSETTRWREVTVWSTLSESYIGENCKFSNTLLCIIFTCCYYWVLSVPCAEVTDAFEHFWKPAGFSWGPHLSFRARAILCEWKQFEWYEGRCSSTPSNSPWCWVQL